MDGNHLKGSHMQRLERLGETAATIERLGKNLQVFKRFGTFAAIIHMFYEDFQVWFLILGKIFSNFMLLLWLFPT